MFESFLAAIDINGGCVHSVAGRQAKINDHTTTIHSRPGTLMVIMVVVAACQTTAAEYKKQSSDILLVANGLTYPQMDTHFVLLLFFFRALFHFTSKHRETIRLD